jgi:trypsin
VLFRSVQAHLPAEDGHFCGGSLIAQDLVLTAAHCLYPESPENVDVVVGRDRLSDRDGQRIDAKRIAIHPLYLALAQINDVALIKLEEPANAAVIAPATPADSSLYAPGAAARVLGWGLLKENGAERPDELYQVDLNVVDDETCREAYLQEDQSGQTTSQYVPEAMMCAAAPRRDSCQGDSGGPLVADDSGAWKQIGIVSFGTGCARAAFPGIYSRVANMLDFIQDPDPVWAPYNVKVPRINDRKPRVGDTLRCRKGKWRGEDPKFGFNWIRWRHGEPRKTIREESKKLPATERVRGWRVVCEVFGLNRGGLAVETSRPVRVRGG